MTKAFRKSNFYVEGSRVALCVLLAVVLSVLPAYAFLMPLSETAVREAYFLGQRTDQKSADFLELYRHALPFPDKGPYVSEIHLFTPYAQVVATSHHHTVGYSSQQAATDYHGRGDTILIQIRIELTPTFTYLDAKHVATDLAGELNRHLDPDEFWRAFQFSVTQTAESHELKSFEPFEVHADRIISKNYVGSIVSLKYDADQFDSIPTRVEVVTTTGQHVVTDFDLAALR